LDAKTTPQGVNIARDFTLLLCRRDAVPTSERRLEDMKRGEIRWSTKDHGWEILIPSVAFKNANSSFFGSKPFRLILPDLGGLYEKIEAYVDRHRKRLIGPAADSGTFFVKTAKTTSANAAYNQHTFYEAWRLVTQRYGVYCRATINMRTRVNLDENPVWGEAVRA